MLNLIVGVEEYFKRFQSSSSGVKHYIVTSGIRDYVMETPISESVDGIYGVTFKQEDGIFQGIDFMLSDEKKVDIIKKIQSENKGTREITYFGDGLTDQLAFEYVHSIGGQNAFIASGERAQINYAKINANGIMNYYFEPDFGVDSEISQYMKKQVEIEKNSGR